MYYLAPPECGISSFVLVLGRSHNPHCCHVDEPKAAENQGKPSKKTIINTYKYMQFPLPPDSSFKKKKTPNVQKMLFNIPNFAEGLQRVPLSSHSSVYLLTWIHGFLICVPPPPSPGLKEELIPDKFREGSLQSATWDWLLIICFCVYITVITQMDHLRFHSGGEEI